MNFTERQGKMRVVDFPFKLVTGEIWSLWDVMQCSPKEKLKGRVLHEIPQNDCKGDHVKYILK